MSNVVEVPTKIEGFVEENRVDSFIPDGRVLPEDFAKAQVETIASEVLSGRYNMGSVKDINNPNLGPITDTKPMVQTTTPSLGPDTDTKVIPEKFNPASGRDWSLLTVSKPEIAEKF